MYEEKYKKGAEALINKWGHVKQYERVLIIIDESTEKVGSYLLDSAKEVSDKVKLIKIKQAAMHGEEPPEEAASLMFNSDVVFGATKFSLTHTEARRIAEKKGVRYLTLADYSLEQLRSPALQVDYLPWAEKGRIIKESFDAGHKIKITTEKGTKLLLDISTRVANHCPGYCDKPGMLGSPPDIETNISPIEEKSEGVIVVDGSIPCKEVGLIDEDIKIYVKNGSITYIDTSVTQGQALKKLLDDGNNQKKKILAEFGVGLNPSAKLCGSMLEDEGCLGTVHFGFGSNYTVGGENKVNFHLDLVIKDATVYVDDNLLIADGNLLI